MKKIILLSIFLLHAFSMFAQLAAIQRDIFGDLDYQSRDGNYQSSFKKNVFDDLTFTDSRNNKVTLEKKYLNATYPGILGNEKRKRELFYQLIQENRRGEGYVAKYSIDIFNKLIIEDNEGYKLEKGKDIFGHEQIAEQMDGVKTSFNKTINGTLEYSSGKDKASLKKDIFDKYLYSDSFGNELQFNEKTWRTLTRRYETDEDAFMSLIDQFFYR
ncbi:hypothetical protein [Sphingobacterium deserti]|uniref:Uncharacterized protein n=1 Tax=Sphingobacterium deserti TaxID=1229276 RepID=A0A0B8T6C0_9SPHI|nr:hypothetical protein [Sphingobacterium deserti]KGE13539.1 hypothetical protein DI53_2727 [Sphingobacterium deserti]